MPISSSYQKCLNHTEALRTPADISQAQQLVNCLRALSLLDSDIPVQMDGMRCFIVIVNYRSRDGGIFQIPEIPSWLKQEDSSRQCNSLVRVSDGEESADTSCGSYTAMQDIVSVVTLTAG